MKKMIFLALAVLSCWSAFAGKKTQDGDVYTLKGKIINQKTEEVLPGATVYIPDIQRGVVTDEHGYYEINHLSSGKYLVEVRYAGFSTTTAYVRISGEKRKDWALSPEIIEGKEVVVTGISKATQLRKMPTHITVLDHAALQEKTTDNIIGKIADVPGVSAVTTGPNVMKPVIRGLSSYRVVVVNNGIRQQEQQWGAEHGVDIDAYAAGSMNVIRGASSLMYGSDALGGVINVLPPRSAPEGHIKGSIVGNYQSNNGLYSLHAGIKGNTKGFVWRAYGTTKRAHDYKNKYDGYVFNSKFKENDFGAEIGLDKDWGYSHLSFSSYDLTLGIPEGERDAATGEFLKEVNRNGQAEDEIATTKDFKSYDPFIGRQRVQHRKLTWNNKIHAGDGNSLNVTLGLQQNKRQEFDDILAPDDPGLGLRLNALNYNAHYSFSEAGNWDFTGGISGMWENNENFGSEFLIPDYHLFDIGAYGIAKKEIHRLTFTGGLRIDWRNIRAQALEEDGKPLFEAFDRDFSAWSGSLGLSYQLSPRLVLKANMAKGFRAPAIPELAANGVHEGTSQYMRGNTRLNPENSMELDAGAAFESDHISASLYGFLNNIHHYIYYRKLLAADGTDSVTVDEGKGYRTFQYEQTKARLYGVEASIDIHPHPLDWLHFKNTFSFVRGERVGGADSTRNLPLIPAARWTSELGFRLLPEGPVFRKLFVNFKLKNTFRQNHFMKAYHTETATPAYTLLDIEAGSNVVNRKGKVLFKVFVTAQNITDVAYQDHLNRLKYLPLNQVTGRRGIFNMGRNFSFKVVVPFDFK